MKARSIIEHEFEDEPGPSARKNWVILYGEDNRDPDAWDYDWTYYDILNTWLAGGKVRLMNKTVADREVEGLEDRHYTNKRYRVVSKEEADDEVGLEVEYTEWPVEQ